MCVFLFLFCCSFHRESWQRPQSTLALAGFASVLRRATTEDKVFDGGLIKIKRCRANRLLNARQLKRDQKGLREKYALITPIFQIFVFVPMRLERGRLARCLQPLQLPAQTSALSDPSTFLEGDENKLLPVGRSQHLTESVVTNLGGCCTLCDVTK